MTTTSEYEAWRVTLHVHQGASGPRGPFEERFDGVCGVGKWENPVEVLQQFAINAMCCLYNAKIYVEMGDTATQQARADKNNALLNQANREAKHGGEWNVDMSKWQVPTYTSLLKWDEKTGWRHKKIDRAARHVVLDYTTSVIVPAC